MRFIDGPFSDDALRYSLCGFDLAPLERMLLRVNRVLKRNKAFQEGRVQGRIVAALDGIEGLASYSRSCQYCLEPRVKGTDDNGHSTERLQYYHRAVGCRIVSSPVRPLLAVEWLRPGEGEDTAALRLLARLPQLYGSPCFDIPFTPDHPQPVRVVRSKEPVTARHYRRREPVAETTGHTWWWITTLDTRTFPVRQLLILSPAVWLPPGGLANLRSPTPVDPKPVFPPLDAIAGWGVRSSWFSAGPPDNYLEVSDILRTSWERCPSQESITITRLNCRDGLTSEQSS